MSTENQRPEVRPLEEPATMPATVTAATSSPAAAPASSPAAAPASEKKGGMSDIVQILLVAVAASVIGVAGYFLLNHNGGPKQVLRSDHPSSSLTSQKETSTEGSAPATAAASSAAPPFVVINSDVIAANAMQSVQKAFQSNPALLPHLGQMGQIVGAEIQAEAKNYVSKGFLVYNASGLLGYPASADRTKEVEKMVMARVEDSLRTWSAAAPASAAHGASAASQQSTEGFEP